MIVRIIDRRIFLRTRKIHEYVTFYIIHNYINKRIKPIRLLARRNSRNYLTAYELN